MIVHNAVAQRQLFLYSSSSEPTSRLRCGQVEVRGLGLRAHQVLSLTNNQQPSPHRTLAVVSDFDLSIFQPLPSCRTTTSSQHARPSGVLCRRSDGLECAAWRPLRPVTQCRQFQEDAKDASVSECTWTLSALEALRNALYKFKTYLLTYLPRTPLVPICSKFGSFVFKTLRSQLR